MPTFEDVFGSTRRTHILSIMLSMTNQEEKIYIRKLVLKTGYTAQTVTTHINEMEASGVLSRWQIEGNNTKYIALNPDVRALLNSFGP